MGILRRLLCLGLLAGYAVAATAARPNIILITVDTTRADRMGFLGSKRGLTPNLDALAQQGVVFSRAYAHVPITTPSHATILTGTYPQFNHVNDFAIPVAKTIPFLPEILREQGYKTAAFVGSAILDPLAGGAPGFDRGFDTYDAGFGVRRPGDDRYQTSERRGGEVVARALNWLGDHSSEPFFLWVHVYDPHIPYEPPEPFKSRFASEPYDGEIAYADSVLGTLLQQLRARGLYESAVIALMADHGEALGEHGELTHGIFLYDETLHVPLVFKMPGEQHAGERVEARAGLVDVLPTILEIVGIPAPKAVQGESLVALMNPQRSLAASKTPAPVPDRPVYAEDDYSYRAFGWSSLRALRTGKYLFVEAPRKELYDQSTDPRAERNLSSAASAVTATLGGQLDAFRKKTSSSDRAPEVEADPQREQQLAALGYVASSNTGPAKGGKETDSDPKDKIDIANQMEEALLEQEDGHWENAIRIFEQVLKKEPGIAVAYQSMGMAWMALKNYDKALFALRKAVELRPDAGSPRLALARALWENGDRESAVSEFKAAIADSPGSANPHVTLAALYNQMGRPTDAQKELETALHLQPDGYSANLMLGHMLITQDNASAALPYLQKAVELQPNSPDAHSALADAYAQLGQAANALRERLLAQRMRSLGGR